MTIDWKNACLENIEIVRTLGSGGFGTCYEACLESQRVCVKQVNRTSKKMAAIQSFEAETRRELFNFDHPNIVKILAVSEFSHLNEDTVSTMMIIFEFIDGRSLQAVIDDQSEKIDLARMCRFGHEIASALDYAHSHRIAHLDLKPANVMMTSCGSCKLIDFGCSQYIEEDPVTPTRSCLTGTFAYRAPELLKGGCPTAKCDVYALGVCLWQFWSRAFPFSGMNQHAVIFQVVSKHLRPPFEEGSLVHYGYKSLVVRCWSANPSCRPEMADVIAELKNITKPEEISKSSTSISSEIDSTGCASDTVYKDLVAQQNPVSGLHYNPTHCNNNNNNNNKNNENNNNKNDNKSNKNDNNNDNNNNNNNNNTNNNNNNNNNNNDKSNNSSNSNNSGNISIHNSNDAIIKQPDAGTCQNNKTTSSSCKCENGGRFPYPESHQEKLEQKTFHDGCHTSKKQTMPNQRKRKLATVSDHDDEDLRRSRPRQK